MLAQIFHAVSGKSSFSLIYFFVSMLIEDMSKSAFVRNLDRTFFYFLGNSNKSSILQNKNQQI